MDDRLAADKAYAKMVADIHGGALDIDDIRLLRSLRDVRQDMRPLPPVPSWFMVDILFTAYDALTERCRALEGIVGRLHDHVERAHDELEKMRQRAEQAEAQRDVAVRIVQEALRIDREKVYPGDLYQLENGLVAWRLGAQQLVAAYDAGRKP